MNFDHKTKIKEEGRFEFHRGFDYGKRGYYFHADEDFREDWSWEENKTTYLPVSICGASTGLDSDEPF